MIEKIKDYLYDISDVLLSLIIIAVMVFSISYIMTDAFKINIFSGGEERDISSIVPENAGSKKEEVTETDDGADEAEPEETDAEETPDTETATEEGEVVTAVKVSIPEGSMPQTFARKLSDAGLIDSTGDFIDRIVERGVDTKLRPGDYTFGMNVTIDEIIDKLIGN